MKLDFCIGWLVVTASTSLIIWTTDSLAAEYPSPVSGDWGSSKPSDGLRGHFPKYGYRDMLEAQYRLLTEIASPQESSPSALFSGNQRP
jgi:hypothetical protein